MSIEEIKVYDSEFPVSLIGHARYICVNLHSLISSHFWAAAWNVTHIIKTLLLFWIIKLLLPLITRIAASNFLCLNNNFQIGKQQHSLSKSYFLKGFKTTLKHLITIIFKAIKTSGIDITPKPWNVGCLLFSYTSNWIGES